MGWCISKVTAQEEFVKEVEALLLENENSNKELKNELDKMGEKVTYNFYFFYFVVWIDSGNNIAAYHCKKHP